MFIVFLCVKAYYCKKFREMESEKVQQIEYA
jgi:hypothetical protein